MVHVCGEALGLEQEIMKFYWSTWDITDRCAEALGSEQERIRYCSTSDLAHMWRCTAMRTGDSK